MQSHYKFALIIVALAACGGSSAPADTSSTPGTNTTDTFAAQVERGAALYGANCASCHGASGEGVGNAPAVVGDGVLPLDPPAGASRNVQFRTALDVFLWVKETMPGDDPGSLTDAEYVDILAFDLKANGVNLEAPLDGEVAKTLSLR